MLRASEGSRDGMDAIKSQPATPRPKRRWFQFSLRSLMLFVLCCAIACSWYTTRAVKQREAARAISAINGCAVGYDCDFGDNFVPLPDVADFAPMRQETWIDSVFDRDFVYRVVVAQVPIAQVEEATPHLARLPHLKVVYISRNCSEDDAAARRKLQHDLPGVELRTFEWAVPQFGPDNDLGAKCDNNNIKGVI
jgi:hypothetical protein